jgi:hypothetical protein
MVAPRIWIDSFYPILGSPCLLFSLAAVDLETIKEIIKAQEVRFAKPKEVEEATGSRIGSVSLINPTSEIHLKGIDHNDSVHCQ